jgi:hypothetical protein
VPGSPVGPGRWPLRGPFGAFTWGAWVVCSGLAVALLVLGVSLAARGRGARAAAAAGRVCRGSAGFALLAASAYGAAARADLVESHPVAALALAVAALVALRRLAREPLR